MRWSSSFSSTRLALPTGLAVPGCPLAGQKHRCRSWCLSSGADQQDLLLCSPSLGHASDLGLCAERGETWQLGDSPGVKALGPPVSERKGFHSGVCPSSGFPCGAALAASVPGCQAESAGWHLHLGCDPIGRKARWCLVGRPQRPITSARSRAPGPGPRTPAASGTWAPGVPVGSIWAAGLLPGSRLQLPPVLPVL